MPFSLVTDKSFHQARKRSRCKMSQLHMVPENRTQIIVESCDAHALAAKDNPCSLFQSEAQCAHIVGLDNMKFLNFTGTT
jgi:hypothetical protein